MISAVYRAEVARAEEGDDIAARQLRRLKHAEPGKAEIALAFQLFGVDAGVIIFKQLGTEVNFRACWVCESVENIRTRRRNPIPTWKN